MSKRFALIFAAAGLTCFALPAQSQSTLPDGNGKEIVQTACTRCHSINQVVNSGYTREGWQNTIREYLLPNEATRPRRIAITPDDVIYYSDYSRGYLGRFDPKTGQVTEWPSPGGAQSRPYGITYLKGAIWYSESAVRPNTLVRFDLAS